MDHRVHWVAEGDGDVGEGFCEDVMERGVGFATRARLASVQENHSACEANRRQPLRLVSEISEPRSPSSIAPVLHGIDVLGNLPDYGGGEGAPLG